MLRKLTKRLTGGHKEIPLFYVTFNLKKYKSQGEKGSCDLKLHPSLKGDKVAIEKMNDLVDHIRKHHDMEKLV